MRNINFGIIGCSDVAERRFIPALIKSKSAKLEMIGSRNPQKARKLCERFYCSKYGSYRDVLTSPDVDAVYISIPITLREDIVLSAIRNNKHILIEKPAFMKFETASNVVALCKEKNKRILEDWSFRFHPQHAVVKDLIESKEIGEVKYFHGQFTYPFPESGNIRLQPELGGGVFFDSAGYPVVAARSILPNDPVSIFCIKHLDEKYQVDNFVQLQIEFENNVSANTIAGFGLHYNSTYSILGAKGRISVVRAYAVNEDMETIIRIETDKGIKKQVVSPRNQFLLMIDEFCSQILFDKSPKYDFENDMLTQNMIMDAALKSSVENKSILL